MKYRLYIDEVGNSDMGASSDPNHRFLSLTGVIFELTYVDQILFPELEAVKRKYFGAHADDPVILHRKELVNLKPPFEALRDAAVEAAFNTEFLDLLRRLDFTVLTVVIDKLDYQQRYRTWRSDPYHYCLTVMVERFVLWLRAKNVKGDVMAESRGGKEDIRLKASFERVYEQGSDFVKPDQFEAFLTSKQLKVKNKSNNIAGLQIADIIAHPSFRSTMARRENQSLAENFGGRIAQILEQTKYHRNPAGVIEGWGRKWLP